MVTIGDLKKLFRFPKSDKKTVYKNRFEIENRIKEIANFYFEDERFNTDRDSFIPEKDLFDCLYPPPEGEGPDIIVFMIRVNSFIESLEDEFGIEIDYMDLDDELADDFLVKEKCFEKLVDYVCNGLKIKKGQN